uniref:Uncharacterized protein n=1 Tax=Bos mutus grunniens TaxID=30521 RepID=A0A8B9XSD0_BOSMU
MTMETIDSQQDGSLPDSVAESESAHMQTQTGQNSITLAQCQMLKKRLREKQAWLAVRDW